MTEKNTHVEIYVFFGFLPSKWIHNTTHYSCTRRGNVFCSTIQTEGESAIGTTAYRLINATVLFTLNYYIPLYMYKLLQLPIHMENNMLLENANKKPRAVTYEN